MLVSIIVVTYNSSKFLGKCLDSIFSQDYKNIEVIVVNDGSTDNSEKIINSYSQHNNLVYLYQNNTGVGSARKKGLTEVKGEYVIFVDSDDWIEKNMITRKIEIALEKNSDIVVSDIFIDYHDRMEKNFISKQSFPEKKNEELIVEILLGKFHGSLCNKLIKSELYKKNIDYLFDDITFCEDQLFVLHLLQQNVKVDYANQALYHYVQYKSSLTRQNSFLFFKENIMPYHKKLENIIRDKVILNTGKLFLKSHFIKKGKLSQREIRSIYPESNEYILKSFISSSDKKRLIKTLPFFKRVKFLLQYKIDSARHIFFSSYKGLSV